MLLYIGIGVQLYVHKDASLIPNMQTQVNMAYGWGIGEAWWSGGESGISYLIDQPMAFVDKGRVRLEVLVAKLDKLFSLERFGELLSIQVTKQHGYVRPLGGQRRLLAYKPLQHSTIYRPFERSHEVVPCCGFRKERDERFMETLEHQLLFVRKRSFQLMLWIRGMIRRPRCLFRAVRLGWRETRKQGSHNTVGTFAAASGATAAFIAIAAGFAHSPNETDNGNTIASLPSSRARFLRQCHGHSHESTIVFH